MRTLSRMQVGAMALAVTALWTAVPVEAGNVLRLKHGTVRTDLVSSAKSSQARTQASTKLFRISSATQRKRYFVIQYRTRVALRHQMRLKTLGVRSLRYLPDDALVVEASATTLQSLLAETNSDVRAVLPYDAAWKLSPDLEPASVFTARAPQNVLIRLFDARHLAQVIRDIQSRGGELLASRDRSIAAKIAGAQVAALSSLEGVEWIQAFPKVESSVFRLNAGEEPPANVPAVRGDYTDLSGYESGTKLMNFSEVWARGFRGQGQKIGFADTGLDKGDVNDLHMDLSGRATGEAFGWFASSWEDPVGHGTHVAGSIAGSGAASGGRIIGAAPEATLMAQGMWSPFIGNLTVPPKFAAMLEPAYNEGVRVHSNSWGSPQNLGAYEAMAAQADEFMFDHPDLLLVFSAGNNGVDADKDGRIDGVTIGSPGTAKNVLTVGSSENVVSSGGIQAKIGQLAAAQKLWPKEPIFSDGLSDNANGIAAFSSRGPTQDGRVKPDLVAPGTNILSLRSHHPDSEDMWGAYNQDYVFSGGTSMSTPLVAGAAALVRQYLTQVRGLWNPSAALIKNILMHTAVDLFPGQFGHVGQSAGQELLTRRPNVDEGWGRVDVARAIRLERTILIDESIGVESGGEMKYLLRPPTDGQATLSLVWTDAPGSPAAAQALVNDLDLVLVDPMGQEFTPADRLNNSEVIEKAVRAGDYTVVVRGHNVPQGRDGKQPFALVMTIH